EEIKSLSEFEFPTSDQFGEKIKSREIELSNELIRSMSAVWEPDKYRNDYKEKLESWIDEIIEAGGTQKVRKTKAPARAANVIDIEELLKKSLKSSKKTKKVRARKTS